MNFLGLICAVFSNVAVFNLLFWKGVLKVPSDEFDELEESAEMHNRTGTSNELREIQLNDQVFEQLQDLSVGNVAFKLREIVDELKDEEQVLEMEIFNF